jgi:hypothetical protein
MERLCSSSVSSAHCGASDDEPFGHSSVVGRGRDMQSGVARIHVMSDRKNEIGLWFLSTRTNAERAPSQIRLLIKDAAHSSLVASCEPSEEGS